MGTHDDDFERSDSPRGGGGDEETGGFEGGARRRGDRSDRKERILHTRISEQLSDDIRKMADDLRVPVSNLVRNVLEEAFGAVERVSDEVGGLLDEVLGEAGGFEEELRSFARRRRRRDRGRRRRRSREYVDYEDAEPAGEGAASATAGAKSGPRDAPPATAPAAQRRPSPASAPAVGAGASMPFPEVLGWQSLLVNAAQRCACDERELAPGERAFVGLSERGLSRTFLCRECMAARSASEPSAAPGA